MDLAILVAASLGLTAAFLFSAVVVSKGGLHILDPRNVVFLGFFFIYVVSYLSQNKFQSYYLNSDYYPILSLLAVLSALAFAFGFSKGNLLRHGTRKLVASNTSHTRSATVVSSAFAVIGMLSWVYFIAKSGGVSAVYGSVHGEGGAWETTSAYIYRAKWFLYPAIFIAMFDYLLAGRKPIVLLWLMCMLLFVALDAYWLGSRGAWIRIFLVIYVPMTISGLFSRFRRSAMFVLGGALVLLVLLLPYVRHATMLGANETVVDAISDAFAGSNVLSGSTHAGVGQELNVAAAVVHAFSTNESFMLGTAWIYPIINFVPRVVWPSKPYYYDWVVNLEVVVWKSDGWVIGLGSAMTGLADGFSQFGFLSVFFWALLGYWGGRLWVQARSTADMAAWGHLLAFLIGLVYFVTQDFKAGFYGWFFFSSVIWIANLVPRIRWRNG